VLGVACVIKRRVECNEWERLPYQCSGNIIHIEGIACDLKRDVKFLGSGVRKKGYSTFWGKK